MRLPSTAEDALAETDRNAAWMRRRFPDMLLWVNESYSGGLAFWSSVSLSFTRNSLPDVGAGSCLKVAPGD
jgi:hypothetical protein